MVDLPPFRLLSIGVFCLLCSELPRYDPNNASGHWVCSMSRSSLRYRICTAVRTYVHTICPEKHTTTYYHILLHAATYCDILSALIRKIMEFLLLKPVNRYLRFVEHLFMPTFTHVFDIDVAPTVAVLALNLGVYTPCLTRLPESSISCVVLPRIQSKVKKTNALCEMEPPVCMLVACG
jgi:hypothetical protein